MKQINRIVRLLGLALLIASIVQELRKPASERTWHGSLAGLVPYDLRFPTPARLRAALWNPEDPRLLVPTAFGVGWSVNFAALASGLPGTRGMG